MGLVNVLNVQVLNNPSTFESSFKFEITFECISQLKQDLEWKIVYVGSAEGERYDQILDCVMVGPVPVGINKFVFEAAPPNPALIPSTEVAGVTVILLICSYLDQEFVRVGYYVDNNYEDLELRENPPNPPLIDLLKRNILADKPRVTKFDIKWDPTKADEVPQDVLNAQVDEESDEDEEDDSEFTEDDGDYFTEELSSTDSIDEEMSETFMDEDLGSPAMVTDVDPVPSQVESMVPSPTHQIYLESMTNGLNESTKLMSNHNSMMDL